MLEMMLAEQSVLNSERYLPVPTVSTIRRRPMACRSAFLIAATTLLLAPAAVAVGPSFIPDVTFNGSNLTGWHPLGNADWRAQNGEFVATLKQGGGDGWLVLDHSFQDVGFYVAFQCSAGCKTGILLRAEQTPNGMKGVLVSLNEGDLASYRVTLDARGQITQRDKLRYGGLQVRIAPAPDPNAPIRLSGEGLRPAAGGGGRANTPATFVSPIPRVNPGLRANDWNTVEVFIDVNIVRAFLNEGRGNRGRSRG